MLKWKKECFTHLRRENYLTVAKAIRNLNKQWEIDQFKEYFDL